MLDIREVKHGAGAPWSWHSAPSFELRGWGNELFDLACSGLAVGGLLCAVLPRLRLVDEDF